MTKQAVTNWYNKIPDAEKDLPLLIVEGNAYTPRMALSEVTRGTPLGNKLQNLIETKKFGTTYEQEELLAKIRRKQILESLPPDKPIYATLSGKVFTPRQLLREIEANTPIGQQWIQEEIRRMKAIMQGS